MASQAQKIIERKIAVDEPEVPELDAIWDLLELPHPPKQFKYMGLVYQEGSSGGEGMWSNLGGDRQGKPEHLLPYVEWYCYRSDGEPLGSSRDCDVPMSRRYITVLFRPTGWALIPVDVTMQEHDAAMKSWFEDR